MCRSRGAALITALFVVALVAAAAVAMISEAQISIRRTELIINYDKNYLTAQIVQNWAIYNLGRNFTKAQPNKKLTDTFPEVYPKTKLPNGYFTGNINDMQALFNINDLTNKAYQAGFIHFLQTVDPAIKDPKTLMLAIINWISPMGTHSTYLDEAYTKAKLPYHVAHQAMVSISELRLVLGVTAEIYNKISPYLTALPPGSTININTTSAPVLLILNSSLDLNTAHSILKARPFLSRAAFSSNPIVQNHHISDKIIVTRSDYFLSRALVKRGQQTLLLESLLHRMKSNKGPEVKIIWQTQA